MKNNSNFENIVRPILVLTIICFVVSGLLAVTHSITQPVIDANVKKESRCQQNCAAARGRRLYAGGVF